jgi:hypothetical protein
LVMTVTFLTIGATRWDFCNFNNTAGVVRCLIERSRKI